MGYTTDFSGSVTIDPPLNEHEISFLTDFNQTRRMIRRNGPLFVKGGGFMGQADDGDVINGNRANGEQSMFGTPAPDEQAYFEQDGQPGLWCQWVPTEEGDALEWDGGEKFYYAPEWMKYIVTKLLGESAKAYIAQHIDEDERLQHFTCDHVVNGVINANGEESGDVWQLVVENNKVMVRHGEITFNRVSEV